MFHTVHPLTQRNLARDEQSCNPLAGIEVFHTGCGRVSDGDAPGVLVVIPWRGLRCFTLEVRWFDDGDLWVAEL